MALEWSAGCAALVLGLPLAYGILLYFRRRWLSRRGGTFELSWRRNARNEGRGWVLGIGRYAADELQWFRIFGLSLQPNQTLRRDSLRYLDTRVPGAHEAYSLYPGNVVVHCAYGENEFEISMSEASLMGLQAWIEAAPPSDPALRQP